MGTRSKIDPNWDAATKSAYRVELNEQKKLSKRNGYAKGKADIAMIALKVDLLGSDKRFQAKIDAAKLRGLKHG